MAFKDRTQAGRKLAEALAEYRSERAIVLALPRGGVVVAAEVAASFRAPLDLILVRKIGVLQQPELAMGAVVDGETPLVVRNEDVIRLTGISESDFKSVCDKELAEIERRRRRYLGSRERPDVSGRVTIVIDDGIATGATTRAALQATRLRGPSKLVLAVPVAPADALASMRQAANDVICLEDHEDFGAIGKNLTGLDQESASPSISGT
jgi:putative phosphoribosyl transferase